MVQAPLLVLSLFTQVEYKSKLGGESSKKQVVNSSHFRKDAIIHDI